MTIPSTQTKLLLQSPFQERKPIRNNMVNSSSYISLSDSASSSSSFSDVDQQDCSMTPSEVSVDDNQKICFCGQSIPIEEGEEETGIYCSTKCARQDAMAALTGAPSTPDRSQIRSEPIIPAHNHISRKEIIKHSYNSSIALQQKTMTSTHYRRMEAMETRDDYPIEAIEEAFLTPSSGSTSLYDACEHIEKVQGVITSQVQPSFALQRWMRENGLQLNAENMQMHEKDDIARQSSEIDISHHPLHNTQKRTVSLPASPSLDTDDEETHNQRERQAQIEQEIRELDVELKQRLEQLDKDQAEISLHNTKPIGIFEEEEDVLMQFTSPKLDYEAPLGWRRGSKVYSSNFLGLQLSSDEEDLSSHGSNEALDHSSHHLSRIERLHEALGMAVIDEDVEQSNDIKQVHSASPEIHQESSRIPSALDMAKDLAFIQANWNARQHVRQLSTTSIGEMPQQRKTKMKKSTNQNPISNKRSLTNFFQRRPSQNNLETGISSHSFNNMDRLTKSTSPRFAALKPVPAK